MSVKIRTICLLISFSVGISAAIASEEKTRSLPQKTRLNGKANLEDISSKKGKMLYVFSNENRIVGVVLGNEIQVFVPPSDANPSRSKDDTSFDPAIWLDWCNGVSYRIYSCLIYECLIDPPEGGQAQITLVAHPNRRLEVLTKKVFPEDNSPNQVSSLMNHASLKFWKRMENILAEIQGNQVLEFPSTSATAVKFEILCGIDPDKFPRFAALNCKELRNQAKGQRHVYHGAEDLGVPSISATHDWHAHKRAIESIDR